MNAPRRQGTAFFSVVFAMAIVGFAVVAAMHTEGRKRDAALWVRHTIAVKGSLNRLLGTLRRAESGERGFLATRDKRFLTPFESVDPEVRKQIDDVSDLVEDNPKQLGAIDRLRPLIQERLELLRSRTQSVLEGRADEALASLKGGRGLELTDSIDSILNEMMGEEDRL